ncbi:MAG: FmdB family transcriptional regulator [Planctomycetaceae bacterium]|nr:FmdB family transcriptional regulator [Planctomycetaceae bacterium]
MPTYDYRCAACNHEMEAFQSMSAKPLRKCPECGKLKLKRLIGVGAGIIFKGSGFYETDYARSSDYKDKHKAEKDGGKKTDEKKSDSGSGTKSEAKAEGGGGAKESSDSSNKSDAASSSGGKTEGKAKKTE